MKKRYIGYVIGLVCVLVAGLAVFNARSHETSWTVIGVHSLTVLVILTALAVTVRLLGKRGIFIYAIKEGFVSIFAEGGENGAFKRVAGAMKGTKINKTTTEIDDSEDDEPMGFMGFCWIGLWPLNTAMSFDGMEQVKLVNEDDGRIGMKKQVYPRSIYVPIQYTERLVVTGLELGGEDGKLGGKVDLDTVLTYRMRNVYTARLRNRGNSKLLKANTEEGLRETAAGKDYRSILKLKNATGAASLGTLVRNLNSERCGYGTLIKTTGFELLSIDVVGVELSGRNAELMEDAYAKRQIAVETAEESRIQVEREVANTRLRGQVEADVEGMMITQIERRIRAQMGMTEGQALALAIEKAKAQVLSVGGGQSGAMVNVGDLKKPTPPPAAP